MKKSHRPARIAAALFDFDGTLADTERFGIELDDEAYAYYDIKPTPAEKASLAVQTTSSTRSFPSRHRLGLPRSFAGCTRMARVSPWSRPRSTHS